MSTQIFELNLSTGSASAEGCSVSQLIVELCRNMVRHQDFEPTTAAVLEMKSHAFGILLKKSNRSTAVNENSIKQETDPMRALTYQLFEAKLRLRKYPHCRKIVADVNLLEAIVEEPYFVQCIGNGILQLLFALQQNIELEENTEEKYVFESSPAAFTLQSKNQFNQLGLSTYHIDRLLNLRPRFFKSVQQMKMMKNHFVTKTFDKVSNNKLKDIECKYKSLKRYSATDIFRTDLLALAYTDERSTFIRSAYRVGDSNLISINYTECETYEHHNVERHNVIMNVRHDFIGPLPMIKYIEENEETSVFSRNWECIELAVPQRCKPFVGCTDMALEMFAYYYTQSRQILNAKIINKQQFIFDLKSLLVGVQSETFQHNENLIFTLVPTVTVSSITPATMEYYVKDFLECGTCFKRLKLLQQRDKNIDFDNSLDGGFISMAVCSAVDEFLLTMRQFVFVQPDYELLTFHNRIKNMIQHTYELAYILGVHPSDPGYVISPLQTEFLCYLYSAVLRDTAKLNITLLVFLLKRVCHVYFKHLQKWIYEGVLDDPCSELFVSLNKQFDCNTKQYYDKAYFVQKASVPGFIKGFEDDILQCGKYTNLLMAAQPTHPLFSLDHPDISVCLSFDELKRMESSCARYHDLARELCGEPTTIRRMYEERARLRTNYSVVVKERSRQNLERWLGEQRELVLNAVDKKKVLMDILKEQLLEAKKQKVAERRSNIEYELKVLHEAENMRDQRLLCDNTNIRKRVQYFQELHNTFQHEHDSDAIKRIDVQYQNDAKIVEKKHESAPDTNSMSNSQRHFKTPHSIPLTDFESCFDDDDHVSEYTECISDEFISKFEKIEKDLHALADRGNSNEDEQSSMSIMYKDIKNADDVNVLGSVISKEYIPIVFKRSISDVINSNVLPSVRRKSMQRNHLGALSSTTSSYKTDVKCRELKVALKDNHSLVADAQDNEISVLFQKFDTKFNLQKTSQNISLPDINLNTLLDSELTEFQRNQRHMRQHDQFTQYNKNPLYSRRSHLQLDLSTDRARNRHKVLNIEYNINSGHKNAMLLTPPINTGVTTPMSTTSDISSTDRPHEIIDINKESNMDKPLILLKSPKTPMYAKGQQETLETEYEKGQELQNEVCSKEEDDGHNHNRTIQELFDYSKPYQRCTSLLQSNFELSSLFSYFRMYKIPEQKMIKACNDVTALKQFNLNSISAIIITECLQKSVITPMLTHLELVNNEVMRMFLEDLHILNHFRSLRNYFFMIDGEFGSIICNSIIDNLEKHASQETLLSYHILDTALEAALGSSIASSDRNSSQLTILMEDLPAKINYTSPNILNVLNLGYITDWPLNLILTPESLTQYGNIFKYLLKVRRVSWLLENSYQMMKELVKRNGTIVLKSPQYCHVQQMRHKFYNFVHTLQNHIITNAFQSSWKIFKDDLIEANTIEEIYRKHVAYLKRVLFLCMLNRSSAEFNKSIDNIFQITLRFVKHLKSHDFEVCEGNLYYTHALYGKLVNDELQFDKFIRYTIYLGDKIVRVGYQDEIGEFISMLNFNGYYMKDFATLRHNVIADKKAGRLAHVETDYDIEDK